jgi:hypothetical protein
MDQWEIYIKFTRSIRREIHVSGWYGEYFEVVIGVHHAKGTGDEYGGGDQRIGTIDTGKNARMKDKGTENFRLIFRLPTRNFTFNVLRAL